MGRQLGVAGALLCLTVNSRDFVVESGGHPEDVRWRGGVQSAGGDWRARRVRHVDGVQTTD